MRNQAFIRLARTTELLKQILPIPSRLQRQISDIRKAYQEGISLMEIAIRFQTAPDIIAQMLHIPHKTLSPEEANFVVANI